jgi:hypothetical protein
MNDEPSQDLIEVRLRSAAQFAPVRVLEDHYERDEEGRRRLVGGSSVPIRIVMVEAAEELERLRAAVNALPELLADNEGLREALEEKGSAQWDQAKVGILPEDDSATFFIKMVQFAEKRMAEGEQWMTISMKQYAELLKAAAINAERRSPEGA